jgi:hypothetical protein
MQIMKRAESSKGCIEKHYNGNSVLLRISLQNME